MSETLERFEDVSTDYDTFREAIPKYDEMMSVQAEVFSLWAEENQPSAVCELGVGNGSFAETVIDRFDPDVFVGVDGVEDMIKQTEKRLEPFRGSTALDFHQNRFENWTPQRSFNWIYSSLSIHHLSDFEKRDLFSRIHAALRDGGKFVLCDLVKVTEGRETFVREIYWDRLEELGFSETEIEDRWQQHQRHDRPASLRAMLRWLRETGFSTVECVWKDLNRAIIVTYH